MMENWFWFGLTVTIFAELVLHWFPWPRTLPRVVAYALGLAAILAGCGLWLIPTGSGRLFAGVVIIASAAGLATLLAYGIDRVLKMAVQLRVYDGRDAE